MLKNNLKKGFVKVLGVVIGLLTVFHIASFAQNDGFDQGQGYPVEAFAQDTVAGYSSTLRTSVLPSNANVLFSVEKPNGEILKIPAVAGESGVAIAELSDYHTRLSGQYKVSAHLQGKLSDSRSNTFQIFSESVSPNESIVFPAEQVARSANESAVITVKLVDKYQNPIPGHLVKLISSNTSDIIKISGSNLSDENGEIIFQVQSSANGVSTYSAYDVSADRIIEQRAKVVYFTSNDYVFGRSEVTDYSYASNSNNYAVGNSAGPIDHFEFENIDTNITSNQPVNFALTAKDALGQTVQNYAGRVRFSAISSNASFVMLPQDYSFSASDLGSHTFSLALRFNQPGSYEIEARDIDNPSIFGKSTFNVAQNNSQNGVNPSSDVLQITNPQSGTYSNNVQVISGVAQPLSRLKIFDGQMEIATINADVSGNFTYTASQLTEGSHSFMIVSVNEIGTVLESSEVINITIDTGSPEIDNVNIFPEGNIAPNSTVTVKVSVNEDLARAAFLFNNNIYELIKGDDGLYTGSFVSPLEIGTHPLSFILVDQLGNESRISDSYNITIGESSAGVLGNVSNLKAVSSDRRITLNWTAPETSVNPIKNYRVYFGLSPNQLTEAVDTFTNASTWYVPNLRNATEYYFAVIAIDEKGNTSPQFSNIVSATPNPDVIDVLDPEVVAGTAGEKELQEMDTEVSETGPGINLLILLSAIGGFFYTQSAKKRNSRQN